MVRQYTDNFIKVCMKSWLLCESCIHAELNRPSPRYDLISECTGCAKACFAVVSKLVSNPEELEELPINCILHCRRCTEECEKYPEEEDIRLCGDVCAVYAETVKELASFSLN